jgi:hypothetical protein
MAKPAEEKVPKQMLGKYEEITHLTDAFCSQGTCVKIKYQLNKL